jgi:hypothetical protein
MPSFLHTNYLTGNDTTGDGSTSLPYKTIFKALGVAVSDTVIKVYGGQWAALSGDFTFTYGSQTVNTANNQTGIILVDDILSWEDSQFGFEKFFMKVTAVSSTTITLANYWAGPTQTISGANVKRIDAYPYTGTGGSIYETWNTSAIQPGGRTAIVISGGWSSDFTVQNGWTVVRKTGITAQGSGFGSFISNTTAGIGDWKQNLVFDKFVMHSLANAVSLLSSTGNSFAVKRWAAVRCTTSGFFSTTAATFGYGLYQASAGEPVEFYNTGSTYTGTLGFANITVAGEPRPDECKITIWNNNSSQASGSTPTSLLVGNNVAGGKPIIKNTYNFRTIESTSSPNQSYPLAFVSASSTGVYADEINLYCNSPLSQVIVPASGFPFVVKKIGLTGPQYQKSSMYLNTFNGTNSVFDVDAAGLNINSFYTGYTTFGFAYNDSFAGLNRNIIYPPSTGGIKDTEGLKTWDLNQTVYYKDSTNDWLKIYPGALFSNGATGSTGSTIWASVGVKDKPTSTFTATFNFKTDYPDKWTAIGVAYGGATGQVISSAITPTSSFATYSITVNPADYADWDTGFPIYFGLKIIAPNQNTLDPVPVGYLRSITLS